MSKTLKKVIEEVTKKMKDLLAEINLESELITTLLFEDIEQALNELKIE